MIGIYLWHNTRTNTIYVGQTGKDFEYRRDRHIQMLRGNYHSNLRMQRAYNRDGETAFEFDVLEVVNTADELDNAEKFWIDYYKSIGADIYNVAPVGKSLLGIKHSDEYNAKISAHMKRTWQDESYRSKKLPAMQQQIRDIQPLSVAARKANAKTFDFISPQDNQVSIQNLREYCRVNNLNSGAMYQVATGKKIQYKGWRLGL